jgi:hypothetical protein
VSCSELTLGPERSEGWALGPMFHGSGRSSGIRYQVTGHQVIKSSRRPIYSYHALIYSPAALLVVKPLAVTMYSPKL